MVLTRSMIKKMDNYTFEVYNSKKKIETNNDYKSNKFMGLLFIALSSYIYYCKIIDDKSF